MEYPFKDLLPLDEVLEREGYYKDWTHLDPEVFYSLTQISEYIKTKGFGVDVRLLISQLAEHFGLKTTQVVDLANLLSTKYDALNDQFDVVIRDATSGADWAGEIVLARGGKPTLGDRLDDTTAQLAQIVAGDAITPEQFEGNDYEKVQQAVNYIHSNKRGFVALSRMYNITGHPPINIPKTSSGDRSPLIFGGRGGGILKQDAGWMFDSENRNTGDVYFSNVIFESINGQGTGIINGANLIRTQWHNSHARNVDRILHSDAYTQTNVFNGGSIIGGSGWAFNAEGYYDLVMTGGLLVEHRQHFFKQEIKTGSTNIHNALYNVRFRDILVEGLWGKTFDIQRVESMVVDGVYLEHNQGGYFDFTRADNIDALQISNVRSYNSPSFIAENNITALIEWGGNLLGVSTHNIFSKNLPIHDATLARSQALKIYSHQDVALDSSRNTIDNIDPHNIVIEENKTQAYSVTSETGSYRASSFHGITSNNLDDFIKTGAFNVDSRLHTNAPDVVDNWGILEVKDMSSKIVLQTYIERPSTRIHMRIKSGVDGWSDWVLK